MPLGYDRGAEGVLVPSANAEAVQRIFTLYATGQHSDTTIADDLNARGYRALDWRTGERRLFGRESIRTILKNRAYVDEVAAGGVSYPGRHVPLVNGMTFDRVQALRQARTRKEAPNTTNAGGLLTSIVRCAVCGKRMWYHTSGRHGAHRYYTCSGRDHCTCRAPMVQAPLVDAAALDLLRALTIPADWHAEILAAAEAVLVAEQQGPRINRAALEAQLQRLGIAYADGTIGEREYRHRRDALRTQIAVATATPVIPNVHRTARMLADMAALVDAATTDERRRLVRELFATVWLAHDSGINAITPTGLYLPLVGVIAHSDVLVGWLTGLEPATTGTTIQGSAIELQPPRTNASIPNHRKKFKRSPTM